MSGGGDSGFFRENTRTSSSVKFQQRPDPNFHGRASAPDSKALR